MGLAGGSVGEGCAEVVDDSCDSPVTCVTPPVTGVMGLGLHKGGPEVPIRGARNGARPTDLPIYGREGRGGSGDRRSRGDQRSMVINLLVHGNDYWLVGTTLLVGGHNYVCPPTLPVHTCDLRHP
jgi:hypothetical protein